MCPRNGVHINFYLRNNPEVVLKAVEVHWGNLKHVNNKFKDNKSVVLTAIKNFKKQHYASPELRYYSRVFIHDDISVLINNISKKLQKDIDVIKEIASIPYGFLYIDKYFWYKKDIALLIIENHPYEFKELSDELKKDRDIVKKAVSRSEDAIFYVDSMYLNDEEIVLLALKTGTVYIPHLKERVGRNVLENPEIALIFIEYERECLLKKQNSINSELMSNKKSVENVQKRIMELEEEQIHTDKKLDEYEQELQRLRKKIEN